MTMTTETEDLVVALNDRVTPTKHYGREVEVGDLPTAFAKAGLLDWNVRKVPMFAKDGDDEVEMTDFFGVVGDVRGSVVDFGVAKARYEVLQNEVMLDLASSIVDTAAGDLIPDSVGYTHGGRRVFSSFLLPEGVEVEGGLRTYLFMMTSHDRSVPLTAKVLQQRVVCTNMLNGILGDRTAPQIKLRHTVSATTHRIDNLRDALRISFTARDEFAAAAQRWLDTEVKPDKFAEIIETIFPLGEDPSPGAVTRAVNLRDSMEEYYLYSPDQEGIVGTAWGVLNTAAAWDDWGRSVRSEDARHLGMLGARDSTKRGYAETIAKVLDREDLLVG